jgi:GGDEF domain-containing protein
MWRTIWRQACTVLLWTALAIHAQAQPVPGGTLDLYNELEPVALDKHAAYWIDPTGQASLKDATEVAPDAWKPYEQSRIHAIDGKALWLRFDATIGDSRSRWFLEVVLSGLDRGTLYYRDLNGQWIIQDAGDNVPVPLWPLPGRFPTFELSSQPQVGVTYWLRIEHARIAFASPIQLATHKTLTGSRESGQFMLGAYFGLAALVVVLGAAYSIGWRDRNLAAYGLYVLVLTMGQLAYLGIGGQYLWPNWLHWNQIAAFVLPPLSTAAGLWMVRVITQPARFSVQLDRAAIALMIIQILVCAADGLFSTMLTFRLLTSMTLVTIVAILGLLVVVWWRGDDPDAILLTVGLLPVAIGALFPMARSLELIPTSALTRYSLAIAAAFETPILLYALSRRAMRRRESFHRNEGLPRTDALTGLATANVLERKLTEALGRAEGDNFALLAIEVANRDAIAREYGPEMGERALVVAGLHLRALAKDVDIAARLSDAQFGLLVRGPIHEDQLSSLATAIVARGLRESRALPPSVSLRFHVVATQPRRGPDAPEAAILLQRLQDHLLAITSDSRKTIRIV